MDSFTEDMLERARKRREILNSKMAEINATPPRKRGPPLTENQANINIGQEQDDKRLLNDDSPNKRPCSRENSIKPDTPAIPSVKSRLNQLSTRQETWDNSDDAVVLSPRKAPEPALASPKPLESVEVKPAARRNRLAALAQNINEWEDDLSRPDIKPKEEKTKKVWTPPTPVENTPPKPPRTFEHPSPAKKISPGKREASPVKDPSPVKRFSPARPMASPAKKAVVASPAKKAVVASPAKNPSPAKRASPVKAVSKLDVSLKDPVNRVKQQKEARKSFEPTSNPVSARLAAWQQKIVKVENEGESSLPPALVKSGAVSTKSWKPQKTGMIESALRKESPQKSSPQKSPSKMSPSTRSIQDKLVQLTTNRTENSIAEKVREERKAELDALNNRWKDGLLKDEAAKESAIPSPPPAPLNSSTPIGTPDVPLKAPVTSKSPARTLREKKKDECRDRMREDVDENPNFESKLKSIGFEVESVSNLGHVATLDLTPQRQKAQAEKKAVQAEKKAVQGEQSKPAAAATGSSLYSLIKKQTHSPYAAPSPLPKAPPVKRVAEVASMLKPSDVHDSFDDSFESEDPKSSTSTDQRTSQSSLTSQSTEYSETGSEVTSQDDVEESSVYSDESSSGSEVDDLLDEALEDTVVVDANPVPKPRARAKKAVAVETETDEEFPLVMRRKKESFRRPQSQPEWATPTNDRYRQVRWASGVEGSTTDDSDRDVPYSLDQYRHENAEKRKSEASTPRIVVRHSRIEMPSTASESEDSRRVAPQPAIRETNIKKKVQDLQELVNQEQSVIMQTSNALNQCCGINSTFAGSAEAVECHRLLLMACKKREIYITEMQLLKQGRSKVIESQRGPQGSLTISDIRLPLKQEFMSRIGSPRDTTVHYFVIMLRLPSRGLFTQMVSTHDAMLKGSLDFPNLFKISDIGQEFSMDLEVFGMSITREPTNTPKKKKGLTPKKKPKTPNAKALQSPGGPYAVRTTNFTLLSSLKLGLNAADQTHFTLPQVPFSAPLQGSIQLKMRCLMESKVEHRGFLTMFADVSGFGAWHRRWCVLKDNSLSYWKYPDEENVKEPMDHLDLKLCITDQIGLIPRDVCARPNSFELRTVRRQQRGETDTLVSKCYNTMTTTKHWLSADTKEERLFWCGKLNEALHNVRAWHSDALRPLKQVKSTNPYDSESAC